MPMSIAMAFAPSNSRSRWRSRKPSLPLWTRNPSHTPSPSMKPLSNTETTASARGFSSPLTLIRIDAFRGSETSCIDLVMSLAPIHLAVWPDVKPVDDRELLTNLLLDRVDYRFDVPRADVVLKINGKHGRHAVGRAVYRQHLTNGGDLRPCVNQAMKSGHDVRIGGLTDQQRLRFVSEQCRCDCEDGADQNRSRSVVEGIPQELSQRKADGRRNDARHRCAVLEKDDEGGRVLGTAYRFEKAELALRLAKIPPRL